MSTFNAGAIEANLTLGRSAWTRDLRKTRKEIQDLERDTITVGVDLDAVEALVDLNNVKARLDELDSNEYTPSVDLSLTEAEAALLSFQQKLDRLDDQVVVPTILVDLDDATPEVDRLRRQLTDLNRRRATVRVNVLTDVDDLDALEARLNLLTSRPFTVSADADISEAIRELEVLQFEMNELEINDLAIKATLDADQAQTGMIELMLAMQRLELDGVDIPVDLDGYAKAITQLNILEAQIDILDGREIDVDVDIDRAALAGLVGAAGGDGSGGSLGLLKILLYAILLLSPVLAVAIGALGAAIVGFAAAVAGAVGPVAVLAAGLAGLVKRFKDTDPSEYTPEMQMYADAIESVQSAWSEFLDGIEDNGFELMANAMELLAEILPTLVPLFNATADMLDGVLESIGNFVGSSEYQEMLDFFGGFGVDMLESFLNIGGNLLRFFGRLFQAIAPFAEQMMTGLEDVTAGWMDWADDLENNESFQRWVDNAMEYGPMVLDMLGSLVQAFMNIGEALTPFAGPMLTGLTMFFDLIANADPTVLTVIIGALAGLWLGMSVIVPLISGLVAGFGALVSVIAFIASPIGLVVLAIGALIAAIVYLFVTNEDFRNKIIGIWNSIVGAVAPIINDIANMIRENWGPITEFVRGVWTSVQSILQNAFTIIGIIVRVGAALVRGIWAAMGTGIMQTIRGVIQIVSGLVRGWFQVLAGIFKTIKSVLTGDWNGMWQGLRQIATGFGTAIGGIIRGLANVMIGIFRNIQGVVTGIFRALGDMLRTIWNGIVSFFQGGVGRLVGAFTSLPGRLASVFGGLWSGLTAGFRDAVNSIVGWWNGLSFGIPGFNPPGPGSFPGFSVSTPNIGYFAKGGYITEPMLGVIGEGKDNEIIAPEPVLERIVREQSGGVNIDYGRLAAAVATAISSILPQLRGVTPEQLERLIEAASINIGIDARSEGGTANAIAAALGFELRLLGYGGKDSV